MAVCGIPRFPSAFTGSLLDRVIIQKILGLFLAHWWVKPGPGIDAGLLADSIGPWSLVAGPRDLRGGVWLRV